MKPLKRMIALPLALAGWLLAGTSIALVIVGAIAFVIPFFLISGIEFILTGNFGHKSGDFMSSLSYRFRDLPNYFVDLSEKIMLWAEKE